ncbi:MAG: hypothetical protein O2962_05395 [Cyanobacteria bacterium]|nr:hypothetical protein [Cyanobacteriota bacterium]
MINVQFNNLAQANSEILKAFNSSSSAKALEAYQPLSAKQRKLEKLRALQVLKQSSASTSLADISLTTSSLSVALQSAEGATLQAMLNLLSAKMIEQNKYTYFEEEDKDAVKKRIQAKLDSYQEKEEPEQEPEEEDEKLVTKMLDAAAQYFEQIKEDLIESYSKVLSAISLKNLKAALDDGLKLVHRYIYEVPMQSFKEAVLDPIDEFKSKLKTMLDEGIDFNFAAKAKKTFNPKEIKSLLQDSLENKERKLEQSVDALNRSLKDRAQIHMARRKFNKEQVKLALHSN